MVAARPEVPGYSQQDLIDAGRVFSEVTDALHEAPLKSVREASIRTCQLIQHLPLTIRAGQLSSEDFITQLAFIPDGRYDEPHQVSETSWPAYAERISPTIAADISQLLGGDQTRIQADIVRTCAVVAGWPGEGYQRRLRQVYGQALRMEGWHLNRLNADTVPADPRATDQRGKNTIIYNLIGSRHFMGDTGFKDWQRGVDLYLKMAEKGSQEDIAGEMEQFPEDEGLCEELFDDLSRKGNENEAVREYLRNVRNDVGHFVVARYARVPFILNATRDVPQMTELVTKQEKMARTMGVLLVHDSLLKWVQDRRMERTREARWHLYEIEAPYFEGNQLILGED